MLQPNILDYLKDDPTKDVDFVNSQEYLSSTHKGILAEGGTTIADTTKSLYHSGVGAVQLGAYGLSKLFNSSELFEPDYEAGIANFKKSAQDNIDMSYNASDHYITNFIAGILPYVGASVSTMGIAGLGAAVAEEAGATIGNDIAINALRNSVYPKSMSTKEFAKNIGVNEAISASQSLVLDDKGNTYVDPKTFIDSSALGVAVMGGHFAYKNRARIRMIIGDKQLSPKDIEDKLDGINAGADDIQPKKKEKLNDVKQKDKEKLNAIQPKKKEKLNDIQPTEQEKLNDIQPKEKEKLNDTQQTEQEELNDTQPTEQEDLNDIQSTEQEELNDIQPTEQEKLNAIHDKYNGDILKDKENADININPNEDTAISEQMNLDENIPDSFNNSYMTRAGLFTSSNAVKGYIKNGVEVNGEILDFRDPYMHQMVENDIKAKQDMKDSRGAERVTVTNSLMNAPKNKLRKWSKEISEGTKMDYRSISRVKGINEDFYLHFKQSNLTQSTISTIKRASAKGDPVAKDLNALINMSNMHNFDEELSAMKALHRNIILWKNGILDVAKNYTLDDAKALDNYISELHSNNAEYFKNPMSSGYVKLSRKWKSQDFEDLIVCLINNQ